MTNERWILKMPGQGVQNTSETLVPFKIQSSEPWIVLLSDEILSICIMMMEFLKIIINSPTNRPDAQDAIAYENVLSAGLVNKLDNSCFLPIILPIFRSIGSQDSDLSNTHTTGGQSRTQEESLMTYTKRSDTIWGARAIAFTTPNVWTNHRIQVPLKLSGVFLECWKF